MAYNVGIITQLNKDPDTGEPISQLMPVEQKQIFHNMIILNQIPNLFQSFILSNDILEDGNEFVRIRIDQSITNPNQFKIDDRSGREGTVYFHPSLEGKTVTITSYYGKGNVLIDASRVVTEFVNGDVKETLKELTDNAKEATDEANTQANYAKEQSDRLEQFSVYEDYDNTKTYYPLNKVVLDGTSYINIEQCIGVAPNTLNNPNWLLIVRKGLDGFAAIIENTFVATQNNTTHIVTGFNNYDLFHDNLQVYDGVYGNLLIKNIEYSENVDNLSIDLIGWSISTGESIDFKLYKNLNENDIQTEIQNAITAKNNLDSSISSATEIKSELDQSINNGNLGNISNLQTQDKSSFVNAINENVASLNSIVPQIEELETTKADNARLDNIVAQSGTDNTEIVDARQSSVKNKTFGTVRSRLEDIESSIGFPATNIVPNSDFSNGTTGGWSASSSTNSVINKVLTNTANGTASYGLVKIDFTNLIVGHKYYFRGKVKATSNVCTYLRIKQTYSSESQYTINNPVQGRVYDISGIFTVTATTSQLQFLHGYVDTTTANGKSMELQYVLGIDLTATFGAGNEPTALEVDTLMLNYVNNWFNGTVAPFTDNKELYNSIYKIKDNTLAGKPITGTSNQVNVTNGDGVSGNPIISIPEGATGLFRPSITAVTYGSELSPNISTWIGENGATWNGTAWVIPSTGTLKTNVAVEQGAEYEIDITWTDTNQYDTSQPRLIVSLGTAVSDPQFTGYSDALYKLTLVANEAGTVQLKLGDGVQNWNATISNVSVKKILSRVSTAGKIGLGVFDIYTAGMNFALGGGHSKRTSGDSNNALGYHAQNSLTTGMYNNAFGAYVQEQLTTGLNNIAIGHTAQRYLKSGYYNIGIGYAAQVSLTSGSWNIAIGNESQRDITTGDRNTSIGSRALNSLTTGSNNVAMGRQAGFYPKEHNNPTTTASNQVTIGMQSGQSDSTQADNLTAVGFQAIGTKNATAIGSKTEAKGIGSVAIGLDSDGNFAQANSDNEFILGTSKHNVKVKGTFNIARYTPTGSADTTGQVGDITSDDNYIYVKTSTGWKRATLNAF